MNNSRIFWCDRCKRKLTVKGHPGPTNAAIWSYEPTVGVGDVDPCPSCIQFITGRKQ